MKKFSAFRSIVVSFGILSVSATMVSCHKDKDEPQPTTPTYTVPTTYNFENVNFNAQTKLLLMADALVNEINLANANPNHIVTAARLNALFNNTGNPFSDASLNSSGLKLADWVPATIKTDIANYFDSVDVYSHSAAVASNGVAGVVPSAVSASKLYLLSPTGKFYSQIVKKAIMGICAYNIANVYMKDSINSTTDVTKLAHYWDAAFGFFGVPIDFPTNTTGLKYFGSYSNQVNNGLKSNANIMNAFLRGRAAISNNDIATMKGQAKILIATLDTLDAACIVQEMHETDENLEKGDAVAAYGTLSETLGFIRNLSYNINNSPTRVITDDQILQLQKLIDNANPAKPNLYSFVGTGLTTAQIEQKTKAIETFIGQVYKFSATQLPNL